MKLIDVLNMISKGELKEGAKIIVRDRVYIYSCRYENRGKRAFDLITLNKSEEITYFFDEAYLSDSINEEVELIEPECEHEWAKYSLGRLGGRTEFRRRCKKCGVDEEEPTDNTSDKIEELVADEINGKSLAEALSIIGGKLNEVIRYINKEV